MTEGGSRALVPQELTHNMTPFSRLAERTLADRAQRGLAGDSPVFSAAMTPGDGPTAVQSSPAQANTGDRAQVTLGIETLDGRMSRLVPRDTSLPTTRSQVFSTVSDNQPRLELRLLQGEHELAADNEPIGKVVVEGFAASPGGVPRLEVSFHVDAHGRLDVTARDCATNLELAAAVIGLPASV